MTCSWFTGDSLKSFVHPRNCRTVVGSLRVKFADKRICGLQKEN